MLLLQHGRAVYHGDNGASVIDYFQTSFPDVRHVTETCVVGLQYALLHDCHCPVHHARNTVGSWLMQSQGHRKTVSAARSAPRRGHELSQAAARKVTAPVAGQVRRKGDEENLAEWLVEITVTPDADAGTSFAAAYDR